MTTTVAPCEVCAVVPAATAAPDDTLAVVPHQRIAALVAPAPATAPATSEVLARSRLLDRVAATTPLLPMRFGTVLPAGVDVTQEFLAPHHDRFAAALGMLDGHAQFAVRARYVPEGAVREAIAAEPALMRMHQRLRDAPGRPDRAGRVALGEAVAGRIAASRQQDADALAQSLQPYAVLSEVAAADGPGGYRLADAALLVPGARWAALEQAVADLAARWQGRVKLRLLGPMAAYHFADRIATGEVRWGS